MRPVTVFVFTILFAASAIAPLQVQSAHAQEATKESAQKALPANIQEAIDVAIATENTFVIQATIKQAATQYPEHAATILAQMPKAEGQKQDDTPAPAEVVEKVVEAETPKGAPAAEEESDWSGTMEARYEKRSGNTKSQEFRGKVDMEHEKGDWRNRFGLEGRYASADGDTIKKDYGANYGLDYKLDEHYFVFGEVDYEVDEFSGYDFRLSESLGAGYRTQWPEKKMMLDVRASMGMRHFREDVAGADTEHEILILKPEATYKWQVRDNVDFMQRVSAAIGQDITTAETETSLTYKISDKLGLKVAIENEYTSSVPAGTKKLDTYTSTGLVYKLFE